VQKYFFTPTETLITLAGGKQQACTSNPNRIALIFSATSATTIELSTVPPGSIASGIIINSAYPTYTVLQSELGPLVNMEWFATPISVSGTLTVIEIILSKWPRDEPNVQ
jgi:hypothetical protein